MKETIKQLFLLGLSVWFLPSCSEDRSDPNATTQEAGKTVSISLSAEVSVDDPSLRAIDYKLGKNAKGGLVPMPQFTDGQEVDVHTILKSSKGDAVAQTLKWRYEAKTRKLVLDRSNGHNISISSFNNDGQEWYVSGMIGGTLIPGTTRVAFEGERVLKGVDGAEGDIVGSLDVPYFFPWTKLTIDTNSQKDSEGSYQYAMVPSDAGLRFTPLGALIAYKLGNAQTSGAYSFTPTGFTVSSNHWGDQGEFNLNTIIPEYEDSTGVPRWLSPECGSSMYYTFAEGHMPGEIPHEGMASKIYYAWVMPYTPLNTAQSVVNVMLNGTSSKLETSSYKDYTQTYFTDYAQKTVTQGRVQHGKVYEITARAKKRVVLPIEYVTEYNLAGGTELSSEQTPADLKAYGFNAQREGATGVLRFAKSHSIRDFGYYNLYKTIGLYHENLNPTSANLSEATLEDTDGSLIPLQDKYFLPTNEYWWGVVPSQNLVKFDELTERNRFELMAVGIDDVFRRRYHAYYSKGYKTDSWENGSVFYGIRFAPSTSCYVMNEDTHYDALSGTQITYTYLPALDNSLRCAYRFRRVGQWQQPATSHVSLELPPHVVIDVVYLGEKNSHIGLETISEELWWKKQAEEGKVISRVLPTSGSIVNGRLLDLERRGFYWGSPRKKSIYEEFLSGDGAVVSELAVGSWYSSQRGDGSLPVRLFRRNVE